MVLLFVGVKHRAGKGEQKDKKQRACDGLGSFGQFRETEEPHNDR